MNQSRQRRWLIGVLLSVLALAFCWWVYDNTEWRDVQIDTPARGEAITNPLYAAGKLAQLLGVKVEHPLSLEVLPPQDAVMVLTANFWDLLPEREQALREWVENGGRLVVGVRLVRSLDDDDDENEEKEENEESNSIGDWIPVDVSYVDPKRHKDDEQQTEDDAADAADETEPEDLSPWRRAREIRCSEMRDASDEGKEALRGLRRYQLCPPVDSYELETEEDPVWSLSGPAGLFALRIAVGKGFVTVLESDQQFANNFFLQGDNGRFFVAATGLRAGDALWFVTREDADPLLVLIWRHGSPVLVLLAAALVFALWRGLRRFGPIAVEPGTARRSLAEQIRGTAEFVLRYRRGAALHKAQVRALHEAAARRVQGWRQLAADAQFDALARLTSIDAAALQRALNLPAQATRRELDHALALLETARRSLLDSAFKN